MLEYIRSTIMRGIFGGGLSGDLAERGLGWLSTQTRSAIARQDQPVTKVRLRPGETYTVIARPKATKLERRLARKQAGFTAAEKKLSVPTRRQKSAARKLQRSQRQMSRRKMNSRRFRNARRRELRDGAKFDRLIAPSKKLLLVRSELSRTEKTLSAVRERNYRKAQRKRGEPRESLTVYSQ